MKTTKEKSIYTMMEQLAAITTYYLEHGELENARKCLLIGERILLFGSHVAKNAVKNIYIYSLSMLLDVKNEIRKQVLPLMPRHIREEYEHLHYISGI